MASLRDVLVYLCRSYPNEDDLSNARLTKMVYLADWRHAIRYGAQITPIKWYFDSYGPFVRDVEETAARENDLFVIKNTVNAFGERKKVILCKPTKHRTRSLKRTEQEALDYVVRQTKKESWNRFIKLVYSTYPIANSERYTELDLAEMAQKYRKLNKTVVR